MCACAEPSVRLGNGEEEVAIEVSVFNGTLSVPMDTAALSIWVDHDWFVANGGQVTSRGGAATAADGHDIGVVGAGKLTFSFWDRSFTQDVRIMSTLPDKLLIGIRFGDSTD